MVPHTIRELPSESLMAKCNAAGSGDLSQLSLLEYQKQLVMFLWLGLPGSAGRGKPLSRK